MTLLKIYRDVAGMTQTELAKRLGTTQQSYARWESGTSRVPDKAMRELAEIFCTTVDKLSGRKQEPVLELPHFRRFEKGGSFWGHFGVRLPDAPLTKWFAITSAQAGKVRHDLADHYVSEWIVVHTLSNRVLAIRPEQVQRIWLLADSADWPADDREGTETLDGGSGMPLAVYSAMAAWVDQQEGVGPVFDHLPFEVRRDALDAIHHAGLASRPADLNEALRTTVIHSTDGSQNTFTVERADLLSLLEDLNGDLYPQMIKFADTDRDFESFFPAGTVRMIDMPLVELAADQMDT